MIAIGLTGKARAGKDTAASILEGYGFQRFAFADILKDTAKALFGFSELQVNGIMKEAPDTFWDISPREVLQRLGTEAIRGEFGDDFWIHALRRSLLIANPKMIVISDVRFDNEADFIRCGFETGIVVEIVRAEGGIELSGHASEQGISRSLINYSIENNGTIQELGSELYAISYINTAITGGVKTQRH